MTNVKVVESVAEIYRWLDVRIEEQVKLADKCEVCGRCCDFDAFGHRLFVTTPELMYLSAKYKVIKPMTTGRCPWQEDNKCTIYDCRFASCRIFCCKGDSEFQGRLTEETLGKLKSICVKFGIGYRYMDLPSAVKWLGDSGGKLDT